MLLLASAVSAKPRVAHTIRCVGAEQHVHHGRKGTALAPPCCERPWQFELVRLPSLREPRSHAPMHK
eukprot:4487838-Pleurochrysis_carterae.AAC.3